MSGIVFRWSASNMEQPFFFVNPWMGGLVPESVAVLGDLTGIDGHDPGHKKPYSYHFGNGS